MNLLFKKLVKKAVIDRPTILYTKMTQTSADSGSAGLSSGIGFTMPASSSSSSVGSRVPVRSLILSLIVMATAVDYITRVNINIAIVTMVTQNSSDADIRGDVCPLSGYHASLQSNSNSSSPASSGGDLSTATGGGVGGQRHSATQFDWTPTTQGVVLGSFWYTYMMMQVPSGRLAETVGGKTIVTISLIGSGLINLVTPLIASRTGLLVASRMLLGVVQGGIFPSCYAMIGKWFPLKERSLGFAFMEIGATIGSVAATTSAGYLSEHGFAGGWPSVFYMSGLVSLAAFVAWFFLTESSPLKYQGITSEELRYIQSGCEEMQQQQQQSRGRSGEVATVVGGASWEAGAAAAASSSSADRSQEGRASPARVPWVKIFTSPPVLAIITSKFCLSWCFFTLLTKLPAYLHDVLHVSPTQVSSPTLPPTHSHTPASSLETRNEKEGAKETNDCRERDLTLCS